VGNLLIPLHNLTADGYQIRGDEGLIWIEFTKTSMEVQRSSPRYKRRGNFYPIESHKTNVPIETYFARANQNNPIPSSIPEFVRDARAQAAQATENAARAEASASAAERSARNLTRIYFGVSALAILIGILGFHQYLVQIEANVETTSSLASSIRTDADNAKSAADRSMENAQAIRQDLEAARRQIDDLRGQLANIMQGLDQLRRQTPPPIRPPTR
jgi:hypothetical protein